MAEIVAVQALGFIAAEGEPHCRGLPRRQLPICRKPRLVADRVKSAFCRGLALIRIVHQGSWKSFFARATFMFHVNLWL